MSFEDRFVDFDADGYDLALRATADPLPAGRSEAPVWASRRGFDEESGFL
jgi:hypothetical protein